MIRQTATVPNGLSVVVALIGLLATAGRADQAIRSEAQHVVLTPSVSDDTDVVSYNMKLDIRLTNRSERSVYIPKSEADDSGTTRIAILGVQSKQPDGTWAYVIQSSWYDVGTTKYGSCTSVSLGSTAEFRNVASGVALLRKQLHALGEEPTVRFNLMLFCRNSDGKVLTVSTTTEGFRLQIPAVP